MSTFTDRCAAVTAALQDLARDLEADLGKRARRRGTLNGTTETLADLRDPGEDVDAFTRQKAGFQSRLGRATGLLTAYRVAAEKGRAMVLSDTAPAGDDLAARTAVIELVGAIQAVSDYDEARALVASFSQGE